MVWRHDPGSNIIDADGVALATIDRLAQRLGEKSDRLEAVEQAASLVGELEASAERKDDRLE